MQSIIGESIPANIFQDFTDLVRVLEASTNTMSRFADLNGCAVSRINFRGYQLGLDLNIYPYSWELLE